MACQAAVGGVVLGIQVTPRPDLSEREDPEEVEGVCEKISEVLDRWKPSDDCEDEDDFRDDLDEYLEANTECEIEITPGTTEGKADILIDDLLALELKHDPTRDHGDDQPARS